MKVKTPFEKAGFKATDSFVLKEDRKHYFIGQGELFTLVKDDGSLAPYFTNPRTVAGGVFSRNGVAVKLDKIKVAEKNPNTKTLLEVLVEELPKRGGWPKFERELQAVQDADREIKFHFFGHPLAFELNSPGNWGSTTPAAWLKREIDAETLAADHATAIITRDQYEAALAPAADADGWIEWAGGECPVDIGTLVEFEIRDGEKDTAVSTDLDWSHKNQSDDIIAYRMHHRLPHASAACRNCGNPGIHAYIGPKPEDKTILTLEMIGYMQDVDVNIKLNDAFELAEKLIDAGYRKEWVSK